MSTNLIHSESEITFTGTTTARAAGAPILLGAAGAGTVVILKNGTGGATAALKAEVACWREGTFKSVDKQTNAAWTKGLRIFWNNSTRKFTNVSTTGTRAGRAFAAATTAATTGSIMLVAGN